MLHHHHRAPAHIHESLDSHDVGMADAGQQPGFVSRAVEDLVIARVGALEDLQRHLAAQGIPGDPCHADRAKGPLAKDLQNLEWARSAVHTFPRLGEV